MYLIKVISINVKEYTLIKLRKEAYLASWPLNDLSALYIEYEIAKLVINRRGIIAA